MAGRLSVFKDAKGHYRWVTISSSAYQDRDGEIVSTKALAQDCDRADLDGDYGPLRWWHVPNLDIGDCDFNMMNGRLLIESGTFRDERVGEILKEASGDYDVSLGFKHPVTEPDSNKVFHNIRRFERSILPAGRASNLLTLFYVKGDDMASQKEKEDALRSLLGDNALANEIIERAAARDKEAQEKGLAFKATRDDDSEESHKDQEDAAEQVENAAPEGSEEVQENLSDDEEDFDLDALLAELDEDYAEAADDAAKEAKKAKKPAMKKSDEEDEASNEEDMGDEDEDGEDWGEEDMDEEKEAGEIPTFLGDIPTDHFASLMAEALSTALEPYFMQLKEIGESVKEMKEASEATKESHTMQAKETAKTVKEQGDELEKLRKAAITQATALAKTQKRLKELEEGAPPAAKGYIASQDEETVVKEGDDILKNVPQADPLADFTKFVVGDAGFGQPGQAV